MKQMRRSPAALLLALLLVLTLVGGIVVTAHAADCYNHNLSSNDVTYYFDVSSSTHRYELRRETRCSNCSYSTSEIIRQGNEAHSFILYSVSHNPNHTHTYQSRCVCKRVLTTYDVVCDGPPCTMPYRFQPIYELQQQWPAKTMNR